MERVLFFILVIFIFFACTSEKDKVPMLFDEIPSEKTGINFINQVENTKYFNIFSYRNIYNGGGVAIGDINNDGLADVYFTNNMGKNKLYLNKGSFQFEDISEQAGVEGIKKWSTGVVMADINHDGWLDIYVCNAGYLEDSDQENELFINNGDLTFEDKAAEWNLNEEGYTTHAAFFDYDLDGDLDAYILNNSFIPVNTLNYANKRELKAEDWPVRDFLKGGGDKMLRNDGDSFTDVTEESGIFSSLIGFGMGITVGDINDDHLPDMYISNDFFERDYLYINQGDGTFQEDIKSWMAHLSLASMGADMADINNDGFPEIFVTEMLPDDEYRLKTMTNFDNYNSYYFKLERDFYHQYMHNTLQYNNRDQSFSEIAWYSGVSASDWSWGALMFDADNDGYRDIYVCNGVYQDVTDQDFIDFFANDIIQEMVLTGEKEEMDRVISEMPSNPLVNKLFKNKHDLTFEEVGEAWGFETPSFSNGAAYGDLDNDGDLDIVINNVNQKAFVYENKSESLTENHSLSIQLKGAEKNPYAIGSKVFLHIGNEKINFQLIPTRGFQSSIDYKMVMGIGKAAKVDSLIVIWPEKSKTVLYNPPIDTLLTIVYQKTPAYQTNRSVQISNETTLVQEVPSTFLAHKEDDFIDFYQEGLVMRMLSREGPAVATSDVNGDGLEDVFIGGAAKQAGQLYLQTKKGFTLSEVPEFTRDAWFEDAAAQFLDVDQDGDMDLFIGSGGNHMRAGSRQMQDRIYINDGEGSFKLRTDALPNNGLNTAVILPFDLEGDGDMDIFVGSRSIPNSYALPPRSYLYENDGQGKFKDVVNNNAPAFQHLGMITDAKFINVSGDEQKELVVVGEWMSPRIFEIKDGMVSEVETSLENYSGWWYALESDDVDGDGDQDLILGNRGENFYFSGTPEAPAKLWLWDFDDNKTIEKIITRNINGKDMPVHLKKELTEQVVSLKKQNLKHTEYANKAIQDLFPADLLSKAVVREGNYFKSAIAINDGNGQFRMQELPKEVQFSCVCDIYCADINGDSRNDLILAGNDSGFLPQYSKLDASFGHVLINNGKGQYERMESWDSGLFVRGDVKKLEEVTINNQKHLLVIINDSEPKLYKIN